MSFYDHLPDLPLHKPNIRYSGVNCALGPSKSIRYSWVRVHIFYCNSARLSNGVRYNGVFVTAGVPLYLPSHYHVESNKLHYINQHLIGFQRVSGLRIFLLFSEKINLSL